jgi:hypothetical protein
MLGVYLVLSAGVIGLIYAVWIKPLEEHVKGLTEEVNQLAALVNRNHPASYPPSGPSVSIIYDSPTTARDRLKQRV